jgi:predicted RNA-binding protein YlqC (UPF0109 family)
VLDENIELMQEQFYPSLVQELVEKEYEVRVVYFSDQYYTIAIFSQKHESGKIDFRNN